MTFVTASNTAPSSLSVPAGLRAIPAAIARYFRVRRTINELRALSPALLQDIGIEAGDIERIARAGRR